MCVCVRVCTYLRSYASDHFFQIDIAGMKNNINFVHDSTITFDRLVFEKFAKKEPKNVYCFYSIILGNYSYGPDGSHQPHPAAC